MNKNEEEKKEEKWEHPVDAFGYPILYRREYIVYYKDDVSFDSHYDYNFYLTNEFIYLTKQGESGGGAGISGKSLIAGALINPIFFALTIGTYILSKTISSVLEKRKYKMLSRMEDSLYYTIIPLSKIVNIKKPVFGSLVIEYMSGDKKRKIKLGYLDSEVSKAIVESWRLKKRIELPEELQVLAVKRGEDYGVLPKVIYLFPFLEPLYLEMYSDFFEMIARDGWLVYVIPQFAEAKKIYKIIQFFSRYGFRVLPTVSNIKDYTPSLYPRNIIMLGFNFLSKNFDLFKYLVQTFYRDELEKIVDKTTTNIIVIPMPKDLDYKDEYLDVFRRLSIFYGYNFKKVKTGKKPVLYKVDLFRDVPPLLRDVFYKVNEISVKLPVRVQPMYNHGVYGVEHMNLGDGAFLITRKISDSVQEYIFTTDYPFRNEGLREGDNKRLIRNILNKPNFGIITAMNSRIRENLDEDKYLNPSNPREESLATFVKNTMRIIKESYKDGFLYHLDKFDPYYSTEVYKFLRSLLNVLPSVVLDYDIIEFLVYSENPESVKVLEKALKVNYSKTTDFMRKAVDYLKENLDERTIYVLRKIIEFSSNKDDWMNELYGVIDSCIERGDIRPLVYDIDTFYWLLDKNVIDKKTAIEMAKDYLDKADSLSALPSLFKICYGLLNVSNGEVLLDVCSNAIIKLGEFIARGDDLGSIEGALTEVYELLFDTRILDKVGFETSLNVLKSFFDRGYPAPSLPEFNNVRRFVNSLTDLGPVERLIDVFLDTLKLHKNIPVWFDTSRLFISLASTGNAISVLESKYEKLFDIYTSRVEDFWKPILSIAYKDDNKKLFLDFIRRNFYKNLGQGLKELLESALDRGIISEDEVIDAVIQNLKDLKLEKELEKAKKNDIYHAIKSWLINLGVFYKYRNQLDWNKLLQRLKQEKNKIKNKDLRKRVEKAIEELEKSIRKNRNRYYIILFSGISKMLWFSNLDYEGIDYVY